MRIFSALAFARTARVSSSASRRSSGQPRIAEGRSVALSCRALTATAPRVRTRPVAGRGQPSVACLPGAHRLEHPLVRPAPLDRTRVTRLAVRVGVALPIPRLRVGAAAAAHPLVAGLDRSRLLPRRVVEVRLDRGPRAAEPAGDLGDGQPFGLAVVVRERNRAAPLNDSIGHLRGGVRPHALDRTVAAWCSRLGAVPV
jgi:hypothetical protein